MVADTKRSALKSIYIHISNTKWSRQAVFTYLKACTKATLVMKEKQWNDKKIALGITRKCRRGLGGRVRGKGGKG